jgi:nucleotide-binding universal stress UspA family protein
MATDTPPQPPSDSTVDNCFDVAADLRRQRSVALHALHVLEYALTAPAPRRQRTWLHRVTITLDALSAALDAQLHSPDDKLDFLTELTLTEPTYAIPLQRLRQELLDIAVATASLRERIEPDATMTVDPSDVRERLATIAHRFRQHQAREADLVYEATGLAVDDQGTTQP